MTTHAPWIVHTFQAICTCGWTSPIFEMLEQADNALITHAGKDPRGHSSTQPEPRL